MGLFKKFWEGTKANWKDQSNYDAKLKAEVKKARREAYLDQARKSARLRARLDAKRKFNPSAKQGGFGNVPLFTDAELSAYDPLGTRERVAGKIKKKKGQRDPLHDLIYNT